MAEYNFAKNYALGIEIRLNHEKKTGGKPENRALQTDFGKPQISHGGSAAAPPLAFAVGAPFTTASGD